MGNKGTNRFHGVAYQPLDYVQAPWKKKNLPISVRQKGYADEVSVGVSAKTRAALKDSKYTEEEYISAAKSIASYTTIFALNEAHMAVEFMIKKLRGHRLCTFKCYGQLLNKLEVYDKQRRAMIRAENGSDQARLDVMLPLVHEDMEENLQRMYYTALNWYYKWKHPEAEIMAAAQMAQLVNDFACNIIHARVMEIRRMDGTWSNNLENLKPRKVCDIIMEIMRRIVLQTADPGPEADINTCRELHYGIKRMEEIISDVDTMELFTAYGIEQTRGKEYLRKEAPQAYYRLHPMEDPDYLAKKEADALAAIEAEEKAKADELAYTTAEIEEAEAKEGMTLEEMFAQKGWNVKTA